MTPPFLLFSLCYWLPPFFQFPWIFCLTLANRAISCWRVRAKSQQESGEEEWRRPGNPLPWLAWKNSNLASRLLDHLLVTVSTTKATSLAMPKVHYLIHTLSVVPPKSSQTKLCWQTAQFLLRFGWRSGSSSGNLFGWLWLKRSVDWMSDGCRHE